MRRIAATLAVVIALLFSAGSAWADYDDGVAAYERGDYATALREIRPLAEQGHADAQHNLGVMYDKGYGVPENDAEAVKWYRKAAEQGEVEAQYNLGQIYRTSEGVPQNYAKAAKWYLKAAEQGLAQAQNNLGVMYLLGNGVPGDYVKAHMWASLAKAQGNEGSELLDAIKKLMTPAQIAKAKELVAEWKL
jgi:TPR repeat protein